MAKTPEELERDARLREQRIARMEADYLPTYPSGFTVTPENKLANAAEYAAFQLGQINRKMGRLIELLEKAEAKKG